MKYALLAIAGLFWTLTGASAQVIPEYDLGGASKPKPQMKLRSKKDQYKRVHQTSLRNICRGNIEETQEFLEKYQSDNPQDAETSYMLGILHAQAGNIEAATESMKQALKLGLPKGRLIAGPREMLKPIAETELMRTLVKSHNNRLVHGPLVGNVSGTTASFWVRTATETSVEVIVADANGGRVIARSQAVKSDSKEDFTAVANVSGLQPDTEYKYLITLNGKADHAQRQGLRIGK